MRIALARFLLFVLLSSVSTTLVLAQSCGLQDTFIVVQNSSLSFNIAIDDYFNNDLSDPTQGLCGIQIGFIHQFVENFEVTLTSPAGQSINIIGPNGEDQFDFTFGAQWLIDFVPCADTPMPDPIFSPQWNNNQAENWVNFGQYTGSYHPFVGCLEDFNTGAVNGNWTIDLNNNPSNNLGAITYLRLEFCDSRGVECCFTAAGDLLNDNIIACVNADTLLIDPRRNFPLGQADTTEFGYTYLISQNGIFTQLDSMLDFRDSLAGDYQYCGFSFRRDEINNLPEPNNILTIDDIRANLTSLTPWLCAELTNDCIDIHIVAPPATTFIEEQICIGDRIIIGLDTFRQTGIHTSELLNFAGCDSIVVLDLFVQELQMTFLDSTICLGDSAIIENQAYFSTGIYTDTLQTVQLGCDSIVELSLIVINSVITNISPVICSGEGFLVGDSLLTAAGIHTIFLTAQSGCDSIVTADLQILSPKAHIENIGEIDCNNPTRILNANTSTPFDELTFEWFDEAGMSLSETSTLEINAAGLYILEVSQTMGGTTCIARDSVVIDDIRIYPIADPGPDTTLTCTNPILQLGGASTTAGGEINYEWLLLSEGHFVNTTNQQNVMVDSAGLYQFIVTNTLTGCADTTNITIDTDQQDPIINTGNGFELNCEILADTLDGSASIIEANFILNWTGNCVENLAEPGLILVDCPGTYILQVTNPNNGCEAQDSVQVTQNIETPTANITVPDTLNCTQVNIELNANSSQPSGVLNFEWVDPSFNSLTGVQPQIEQGGLYELIVIREDNFCRDTATIFVEQDTIHPIAHIDVDTALNCFEPTVLLGGILTSIGDEYNYQWLNNNVTIDTVFTDTFRIDIGGIYSLIVRNTNNTCEDTATVTITEDFIPPPPIQAGINQFLGCNNTIIQLQPDSTFFPEPVSWSWSGPSILEPIDNIWGVFVDQPGQYTLDVAYLSNGCSGSDSMIVSLSDNYNIVNIPDTLYLSCNTGGVIINTEGSTAGIRRWFLDNSLIGFSDLNPLVFQAGTYTLIIDNLLQTCSDTASVEVLIDCGLEIIVPIPDTITCENEFILINASTSLGQGALSYQWSTTNSTSCIIGTTDLPQIEVLCAGDYQLILTNEAVGESDTLLINIEIDQTLPIVEAGENVIITCFEPLANLIGTVEGNETDFTFSWAPFVEEPVFGHTIDFSTNISNTYAFTAKNNRTGCFATDVLTVSINNQHPGIAFGNEFIPCAADSFRLQAFVMPPEGDYTYLWTSTDTGILADEDSLSVLINQAGLYSFTVLNENNGCDSTANIQVLEAGCAPCLEITAIDSLDCITDFVTLNANYCMPCDGCLLQWALDGIDIIDANDLSLTVNQAGDYTLTATNLIGLSTDTTITVVSTMEMPSFNLGPDRFFDCDSSRLTLLPLELTNPDTFNFDWYQLNEATLLSNDIQFIVEDQGTYVLIVTQPLTGCSFSDTIFIGENMVSPIAEAGENTNITCGNNQSVVLNGVGSTLNNVSYLWTTEQATCINGEQTLNPVVTCPAWYFLTVTRNDNACTAVDSMQVFINDELPSLTPLPDTTLTCDRTQITLTGNTPSQGSFNVEWCTINTDGQEQDCVPTLDHTISTAGQYQFSAQNTVTNCTNSFILTVTYDTLPPMVNAGNQDTLFCGLESLNLAATAEENATYSWTNTNGFIIQNNQSLAPTIFQAEWYVLTVESNQNGCTATDSVLVELDDAVPLVDAGVDTVLNCQTTQLELQAQGQTESGLMNWEWSTLTGQIDYGTDSPTVGISDSAFYFVQLTDPVNSCFTTDTIFVDLDNRQPQALINEIDFQLNCYQDTLLLDARFSTSITDEGLIFNWETIAGNLFPDTSNAQVFTDQTGAYRLVITDIGNGCSDSLGINITQDTFPPILASVSATEIDCQTDSSLLSTLIPTQGTDLSFKWRNEALEIVSTNSTAITRDSGWHFLQLQNLENGCITLDSVFVSSNIVLPTIAIEPPASISCDRETTILNGIGSSEGNQYEYNWSPITNGELLGDIHSLTATAAIAGDYQLLIINTENGCADSLITTVPNEGMIITGLQATVNEPPCEGDLFGSISIDEVIGGTPDFTFSLNNQAAEQISFFDELSIGSYTIKVTDSEGCFFVDTIEINPASLFSLDLGSDLNVKLGDSVQLNPMFNPSHPADSLRWIAPGLLPANAGMNPYITPFETQFILLHAFDENGCIAIDTIQVFVQNVRPSFIPTAFSPNGDGENDFFTIYTGTDVKEILTLRVFSRWGNMVFEKNNFHPNNPDISWNGQLNGQPLNSGVYVYYVELLYQDNWVEVVKGEVMLMR